MGSSAPDHVAVQVGESDTTILSLGAGSCAIETTRPKGTNAREGLCARPLATIPAAALGAGAVLVFLFGLVSIAAGDGLLLGAGVIALIGSVGSAGYACVMGGVRAQLDRFKAQNERLSRTSGELAGATERLEGANKLIAAKVDGLEGTVDELQGVSEELMRDLEGFGELRTAMEEMAAKSGADLAETVGSINGVYDRLYGLTLENEKALLKRAAQDLEFLDRDEDFSKQEFQRFLQRIPTQFRRRFEASGLTFEAVAGEDQEISFKEMGGLIDRLLAENDEKRSTASPKASR
ncbi:unnamed protein product [Ostreobium quekettii]|uniref:Uncharacterized protein n=1 Tax=Ostreobium quekettii TaxID=121088 RepID=A0A8S1IRA5_9CHLO|nr:unnamed protein product [Ostreobium quekettii]|eukprot:evm.model.scf_38EXC.2 EVM.evm.TU.scf_38EXC.2   scf_38EXC:26452-27646(+)